jgi:hypothetical protein
MGGESVATGSNRGEELERRFARVEFADGALVRLRYPVTQEIARRRRQITDIDVLSLDFDARLRPTLGIAECKSARGLSGEQDRLLWLRGLQVLTGAQRATLVRESVSARGREVARALHVDLINQDQVRRREQTIDYYPDTFGMVDGAAFRSSMKEAEAQLAKIGDFSSGLFAYLKDGAILSSPHQALGGILTLSDITVHGTVLPDPLATITAGYAFIAFVIAAMRAGGQLDLVGPDGVGDDIELGLGTGNPHDRQLIMIAEMADRLLREELSSVHRAYRHAGAPAIERQVPSVRDAIAETPAWLDRFLDLAERLRRRTPVARQLPQTLDLAIFDALLGGNAWQAKAFDALFGREHQQLLKIALDSFVRAVPALSSQLVPLLELPFTRTVTGALTTPQAPQQGTLPLPDVVDEPLQAER